MSASEADPRHPPWMDSAPSGKGLVLVLLLGSLLSTGGCHPRIPLPAGAILDPARLREVVQTRQEQVKSVRGESRVELFTEEGYTPFSQVVVAERPDRIHIEVLSPFDVPLGIFTTDGERFQLYDLKQQVFYHGPATAESLARLLPLPLPPRDLVDVLLGGPPLLPVARGVSWDERQGQYLLMLDQPDGPHQVLRIDPGDLSVRSLRLESAAGRLIYQLSFEDFEGSRHLPRTFHFEMPSREIDLTLRWSKDRELDVAIPEEAWSQSPPRGARLEHLE